MTIGQMQASLPVSRTFQLASVSFLNAQPLIWGLRHDPSLRLQLDVPARLLDHLRDGSCDVALLPVIDYQRMPGLGIVPSGGIGCDGPTLTVRVFSRRPIDKIQWLACDPDSHTSVALARIILAERYGIHAEVVDPSRAENPDDCAVLLIGDKVVSAAPMAEHQIDLGMEWKRLTGLPFVFAVWMARQNTNLGDLPQRLERAKQQGLSHLPQLVEAEAPQRGWPLDLAMRYLTEYLRFDIGPRQLRAIRLFHELAARHGLISNPRPLAIVGGDSL